MNNIIQLFKSNHLIHSNVVNIIKAHNEESYHKLDIYKEKKPVELKLINTKIINTMNDFYSNYKYHHNFIKYVNECLSQLNYSENDLFVHINRSNDYINHLFIKFNKQKEEISNLLEILIKNENEIVSLFIKYNIKLDKVDIDTDYINNLFTLFDDTEFLHVGYKLILALYNNKLLSPELRSLMIPLITNLKNKVLEIKYNSKISYASKTLINDLQRFNLVSDEMNNASLVEVLNNLFGVRLDNTFNIKQLSDILKIESKKANKQIGIIIIIKNNYTDSYFNISSLFNEPLIKELDSVTGVNKKYIDTYDTLKIKDLEVTKENQLMCFNIVSNTELAYILWSNDLVDYTYKKDPINNLILFKLLRNEPSMVINNYNKNIEQLILDNKNLQISQEFKKVKYYDFQLSLSSNEYLTKLCLNIEIIIKDLISKKSIDDINEMIKDKSLRNAIINIISKSLKLINYKFSQYEISLLLNIANSISQKIIRDMIYLLGNNKNTVSTILKECPTIIKNRIFTNDTIYDRILNSYYLNILSKNI
jgi:hypothetical protein